MALLAIITLCLPFTTLATFPRGPCDPLVPEYCALPMPNSFYTIQDNSTLTGQRVHFPQNSNPVDILGRRIQPDEWNTFDGFSPFPSIITYFEDIDDSNLPPHWDISQSLSLESPTVLYNLQTDATVPHFAELDVSLRISDRRVLMIWPAVRLNDSSQYLVVIKNLRHSNGSSVLPSKAFKALRDSIGTNDSNIEYRRTQYEQYFTTLITSGIVSRRQDLQLLWHFSTASKECITKRLLYMREDSAGRVGEAGPPYTISNITDHYTANTYRHITGIMRVPIYLDSPLPGSHLVINDRGLPTYQMDASATFTILIPQSVANGSAKSISIVQYGHGLFSSQTEVENDYLQEQANRYGYILVSCDQWGMSEDDLPSIVYTLVHNISDFHIVPDRLSQGVLNELLLMKLLKGSLHKDPALTFNNQIVINPNNAYYYGVSLGGIVGQVYMALTTDIDKGVLGVPGGPFGLILPRSNDFRQFEEGMRVLFPDPVDFMMVLSLLNMLWSRCGPGGYMNSITGSLLPGTPMHRVIYQYGLGDAQVNILGLYASARSNNAKMFASNVQETFQQGTRTVTEKLFGFQFVSDDAVVTDGSLAVGYDCHAPPEPVGNIPPDSSTDTHELPRRTATAQQQMHIFFSTGEIHNTCNGSCHDCHV